MADVELRWLLQVYVPHRHAQLLDAMRLCREAIQGGGEVATLALSTPGSDVLKGFVVVNGCRIVKAEMNAGPSLTAGGKAASVAFSSLNASDATASYMPPVVLTQLRAAATLVAMAEDRVCAVASGQLGAGAVRCALYEAVDMLHRARGVLENQDGTWPLEQPARMIPGAPPEWIISFGVQGGRVVTEISSIAMVGAAGHLGHGKAQGAHHGPRGSGVSGTLHVSGAGSETGALGAERMPVGGGTVPGVLVRVLTDYPALSAGVDALMRCAADLCDLANQIEGVSSLL